MTHRDRGKVPTRSGSHLFNPSHPVREGGDGGARGLFLILAGVVTLVVGVIVAKQLWRIGVPDEWQWSYYAQPAHWTVALHAIIFSLFLAVVAALCLRRRIVTRAQEGAAIGACLALGLGIILALGSAGPAGEYEAVPVTASPWIGGYYGEAVHIDDMGAYLRGYPERISGLKVNDPYGHLADHPVGPVLFHWIVNRTMEAWPSIAGWFVPDDPGNRAKCRSIVEAALQGRISNGELAGIWASALLFRLAYWLTLVPVYLLGRELRSREAGLLALSLAALIPSLHLFGPYPDQLFPLLAAGSLYAWMMAVKRRSAVWAAMSAFLVVIGLLWTMAFLAVLALLGVASIFLAWRESASAADKGAATDRANGDVHKARMQPEAGSAAAAPACGLGGRLDWRGWARIGIIWAGAFVLCSLLPTVLFGYDVWGVWRICLSQHVTFAVLFPRSYWSWTLFNPIEFALFTGIPTFLLMAFAALNGLRRWWLSRRKSALAVLPWALLAVLAALDFSGKNLGEVARLWMFLMPLAAVPAGVALADLDRGRGWVASYVLVMGMVQLVIFRLSFNVFGLAMSVE